MNPGWFDDGSGRLRWFDGDQWTNFYADAPDYGGIPADARSVEVQKVNHVLHFLITVLTCGLWVFVWIALSVHRAGNKRVDWVDRHGVVHKEVRGYSSPGAIPTTRPPSYYAARERHPAGKKLEEES